jgi:hypothetical protein
MKERLLPLHDDLLTVQHHMILHSELIGLRMQVHSKWCSAVKTTHLQKLTSSGSPALFCSMSRHAG